MRFLFLHGALFQISFASVSISPHLDLYLSTLFFLGAAPFFALSSLLVDSGWFPLRRIIAPLCRARPSSRFVEHPPMDNSTDSFNVLSSVLNVQSSLDFVTNSCNVELLDAKSYIPHYSTSDLLSLTSAFDYFYYSYLRHLTISSESPKSKLY